MTGKPEDPVAENQDPLVVATWNGNFMRNTNGSGSVNYDELQKVFGKNSVMNNGRKYDRWLCLKH